MPISEHMTEFAGLPVVEWEPGLTIAAGTAYRLSVTYDEAEAGQRWTDKLGAFLASLGLRHAQPSAEPQADVSWSGKLTRLLDDPGALQVAGLVVGPWGSQTWEEDSQPVVEALVTASEGLPSLRALFLGDVTSEENEISWIRQSDVSPLFLAYPELQHFGVRGSENLSLGTIRHPRLRSLVVESGGLPAQIVREIAAAELPELEHLELWLGARQYGGDVQAADLEPLLSGRLFPKLQYLGLRDSENADEIAAAVATAPILERIRVLDLSLGTLGDQGAMSLLASPAVARLQKLDIHHHYCSEAMVQKLQTLGPEVDASDPQEEDDDDGWRYVAVGE